MLSNDTWIEQQLKEESAKSEDIEKLLRLEQLKINQAKIRISKVQDGWEKSFYTRDEAQTKLAEHRQTISKAELEIIALKNRSANGDLTSIESRQLREELQTIRGRNLIQSAFEDKADLIAKLGIRVFPSEDLKSRRISCRLSFPKSNKEEQKKNGLAKVTFGGPFGTIPELLFEKKGLIQALQQMLTSER